MDLWYENEGFEGYYTRHPQPANFSRDVPPFIFIALSPDQIRGYTAAHEAGHAVLSAAFGLPVKEVRVEATRGGIEHPVQFTSRKTWDLVVKCAAGERAADRWMREQGLHTPERGWTLEMISTNCREEAVDYVERSGKKLVFGGRPMPAESSSQLLDYRAACDQADRELEARWPAVMAVAKALERYGTLTGDRVVEIVNRHETSDKSL